MVVLSVLVTAPAAGARPRPITVVEIGGWGSGINQLGLSERGHVVLNEQVPADGSTPSRFRDIRWYRGRTVEIAAEPGRQLDPSGMNDRGVVVGYDRPDGGGAVRGFVWDGEMLPQPEEPSEWWAEAIDERGRILINRREANGSRAAVRSHGREIVSPDRPDFGSGCLHGWRLAAAGHGIQCPEDGKHRDHEDDTSTFHGYLRRHQTQPPAINKIRGSSAMLDR